MNIEVQKDDILQIGITWFGNEKGNFCLVSKVDLAGIEYIFLRQILKCFGDYKIVSESDYYSGSLDDEPGEWDWSKVDILYETDMPYSVFDSWDKSRKER